MLSVTEVGYRGRRVAPLASAHFSIDPVPSSTLASKSTLAPRLLGLALARRLEAGGVVGVGARLTNGA